MVFYAYGLVWLFWLGMIGLLVFWKRSWLPVLALPLGGSAAIAIAAQFVSPVIVFATAVSIHLLFLVLWGVVAYRDRRPNDDAAFKRT